MECSSVLVALQLTGDQLAGSLLPKQSENLVYNVNFVITDLVSCTCSVFCYALK